MKTFLLLLMILMLTQCTWHPAYDDSRSSTDGTLSVKASDPVFACRLKNDLLQRLKAMKMNEHTVLNVNVNLTQGDIAYHPKQYAMRSQIKALVTLTISRRDVPTQTYTFSEVTTFNLNQDEGWLNTQSCDHAHERLLARVADLLILEIIHITNVSPSLSTPSAA